MYTRKKKKKKEKRKEEKHLIRRDIKNLLNISEFF